MDFLSSISDLVNELGLSLSMFVSASVQISDFVTKIRVWFHPIHPHARFARLELLGRTFYWFAIDHVLSHEPICWLAGR